MSSTVPDTDSAFAFRADPPLRVQQALRRVFALEILRDLAAEESTRDGMRRIAP